MIRMMRTKMNFIAIGRRMRAIATIKIMKMMRIMNMMNATKSFRAMKTERMFVIR